MVATMHWPRRWTAMIGSSGSPLRRSGAAPVSALVALLSGACGGSSAPVPIVDASLVARGGDVDVVTRTDVPPTPDRSVAADRTDAATAVVPGLVLLDRQGIPGGHATELSLLADRLFIASSSGGVTAFLVDRDGHLFLTQTEISEPPPPPALPPPPTHPRCTTIAAHPASASLYCAAADIAGVSAYDLRAPATPSVRAGAILTQKQHLGDRQLAVSADTLFLAAFDQGLQRATIALDGGLGPISTTSLTSRVVGVAADGADLAATDIDGVLTAFRVGAGGQLRRTGELDLAGPPIRVTVRGGSAAVALGSFGASVVALGAEGPRLAMHVEPGCPVMAADVRSDRLAVACATGVYLYDLRGAAPRIAGFYRAGSTMLDVRFDGDRLAVLDWSDVLLFRVDLEGRATRPDHAPGYVLHPGQAATVVARNPGDLDLHLHFDLARGAATARVGDLVLAPFATSSITVPAAMLADAPRSGTRVLVECDENLEPHVGTSNSVVIGIVDAVTDAASHVALGDPFPALRDVVNGGPAVPMPGTRTNFAFIEPDCALQWPEVQELGWAQRRARLIDRAAAFVFTIPSNNDDAWNRGHFMAGWGAGGVSHHHFADYSRSIPGHETEDYNGMFQRVFGLNTLLAGPDVSANYAVDDRGVITGIEQFYRGAQPLRP